MMEAHNSPPTPHHIFLGYCTLVAAKNEDNYVNDIGFGRHPSKCVTMFAYVTFAFDEAFGTFFVQTHRGLSDLVAQ
jgi:hypothetical protein